MFSKILSFFTGGSTMSNATSAMFCNQCEQTAKGLACDNSGVCGKIPSVAVQQDKIIAAMRYFANLALAARKNGQIDADADAFAFKALFTTLTNVSFDPAFLNEIEAKILATAKNLASKANLPAPNSFEDMLADQKIAINTFSENADVCSAMQLILYAVKGIAAYADHAAELGQRDPAIAEYIYKALCAGTKFDSETKDLNAWLGLALEGGAINLRTMELLEAGNIATCGTPTPTKVNLGHKAGKAILISGHDLLDLKVLLEQTEGKGINIYTHGEMLPAHGYPNLKKYSHLVGHFGTAWQNQQKEMKDFPGAILFTSNCIQNPKDYADKVFTCGNVSWPGVKHCQNRDFSEVIKKAQELPGFASDQSGKEILTGLGKDAVLGVAGKVLEAVSQKQLRHVFLVGGCDGAKAGRNYFTEIVEKIPSDCLVLTLGCGKFRFFDKDLGTIGELPRLIDMGQCNDAYGAIQVAVALANALNCGVNDLPLSLVISWYEQKAASILLTLLHLGVKNVRLGPSLPAFISPNILNVLVEKFNVAPISTPDADIKAILG